MKLNKFLSIVGLSIVAIPASHAVDGYKNLKFGDSKKEVLESGICSLQLSNSGIPGVEFYACDDFVFSGGKVVAGAYFIDGEFLRFMIDPPMESIPAISQSLQQKYGQPSSSSSRESFSLVDEQPNSTAFLAFDEDTVYLQIFSDASNLQDALLLYTSPQYDAKLLKMQSGSMEGDI